MSDTLFCTPLHATHIASGAKMVPFAGWEMPLQYSGIIDEHLAVRSSAGLFDVSHMGQVLVQGKRHIDDLQTLLSNDLNRIANVGSAQYSLLLNEHGGIEDDLIVYRIKDDELYLVVNASNRDHDMKLLEDIAVDISDKWAMFALQGPLALEVLSDVTGIDIRDTKAFNFVTASIAGLDLIVAVTGYTGERGCEIFTSSENAVEVWQLLSSDQRVTLCGLGARDTLRLEACLPLYGNDINSDNDPISAGLGFAAPPNMHTAIDRIRNKGVKHNLVPILLKERGIARPGNNVFVGSDQVGVVSSGTLSPVLRQGIALAWVDTSCKTVGTEVEIDIRSRRTKGVIVNRPFVRGSFER